MKRDFASLQNQHFDLLICGGGVYGAWTAYDAAYFKVTMAPNVPMITQERAFTSPIWYTPGGR